jgi:hypothetical protein
MRGIDQLNQAFKVTEKLGKIEVRVDVNNREKLAQANVQRSGAYHYSERKVLDKPWGRCDAYAWALKLVKQFD